MKRPYPGRQLTPTRRIFSYRLSRARRVMFGIMSKRFRIFRRPIAAQRNHVENIVKVIYDSNFKTSLRGTTQLPSN
jgi:hypothetical protein